METAVNCFIWWGGYACNTTLIFLTDMSGNMSKCLWFRFIIFSNGIIVQRHQTYEKLVFLKRRKNSVLPTCIQFLFVKHIEKHFLKKVLQNFMENQSCKLNRIDLKMNLDDKKIKVSKLLHTGTSVVISWPTANFLHHWGNVAIRAL